MSTGTLRFKWLTWGRVVPLIILGLSLGLRLVSLDVFLTIDETTWRTRTRQFAQALEKHDWAATYQSEHPGVLTMWAGVAGQEIATRLERLEETAPAWAARSIHVVTHHRSGVSDLTLWARRLVALVAWLAILCVYLLLRPLLGRLAALIALVLLGLDPLFLAHSRLHHLDGLLTAFALLSIVLLLSFHARPGRPIYLALSAVAGGLATANKSPGVLLFAWAGATLLFWAWHERRGARVYLKAFGLTILWAALAVATVVAVWPALWVAPQQTLDNILAGALRQGLNPHEFSNYFWNAIRPDPGPAFYPVAWLFRTTPWVMLGLALLIVSPHKRAPRLAFTLPMLAFVGGFVLFITVADKKFDRYLLPVLPLLDILAGLGLAQQLERLRRRDAERQQHWAHSLAALAVVSQLWLVLPAHPYYTSYYNPVVGGSRRAAHIFLTGWGEGLEQAAAYLNIKPNAEHLHVAAQEVNEFAPFFRGHATLAGAAPLVEPDYFVLYASQVQRNFVPEVTGRYFGIEQPEFVARSNGLEYAWVYKNAYSRREAELLLGRIEEETAASPAPVILNADAALARDYVGPLKLDVISAFDREDYVLTKLARITGGEGSVWLFRLPGMNDALDDRVQRTVEQHGRLDSVFLLSGVSARRYALRDHRWLPDPQVRLDKKLGAEITLVGCGLPEDLQRGQEAELRLHWRAEGPVKQDLKVFVHLVGPDGQIVAQDDAIPQGGAWPTTAWLPGEELLDDHRLSVPGDAPAGAYILRVGLYDPVTLQRLPVSDGATDQPLGDYVEIGGLTLR